MHHHHDIRGYFFILVATLSAACMATFAKLSSNVSIFTLIFFRNVISLFLISPVFLQGRLSLKTKKPGLHFVRSIMGIIGIYCYFYSVQHLELTEAVVLTNTVPLYIPFVAFIWLKTPITKRRILSVILGFLGVLLLLRPGYSLFQGKVTLVGLFGAACTSISFVSIKQLTKTEKAPRILFYYFSYCIGVSFLPMLLFSSGKIMPTTWVYIFCVGISAVCYQYFLTKSYGCLPATTVAALTYLTVIFSAISDWGIWGHKLEFWEFIGSVLIILGGILAMFDRHPPLHLGKKPPS